MVKEMNINWGVTAQEMFLSFPFFMIFFCHFFHSILVKRDEQHLHNTQHCYCIVLFLFFNKKKHIS